MQRDLTASQSRILGYLISSGGNEVNGSSVKEIIDATGLSQNTVYTNLRQGIPGVKQCSRRSLDNSNQYYVTRESLTMLPGGTAHFYQHVELDKWAKDIAKNISSKPATMARLSEIIDSINHPRADLSDAALVDWYIVAGSTLAGIALEMKEK